jgi:type IV pilus assembly protein PilX
MKIQYPTAHNHNHNHKQQKGAILIVSLVVLVALTLIGLSAMDLSNLENIMAANSQQQIKSLSNAEKVLKVAEQDVDGIISDSTTLAFETTEDQYYLAGEVDPTRTTWDFSYASSFDDSPIDGNYIIEYAGPRLIPGESGEIGSAVSGSYIHLFLVDSQSESGKGAIRNVQSVYVTGSPP